MDVANRHQKIYKSFHFEFSQSDFITNKLYLLNTVNHFIGMKLIKIWHFQFGDFEIEKPENCQIVKSLFNWSAWIRADHCCHCESHGPANGTAADDFSFLSERGPRRVSCYYSTRGKDYRDTIVTGYWHLVTPCHLSPHVCLELLAAVISMSHSRSGSVTWVTLRRDM